MFTELQYSTGRPSQRPAAPVQLPSTAGLVGQGPVVVPVVAGSNLVTLPSSDPDGDALTTKLRSLPSTGTLRNAAGATLGVGSTVSDAGPAVYYTPSGTVGAGFTDSFTYGVSDGGAEVTASVQLVRHAMPQVMLHAMPQVTLHVMPGLRFALFATPERDQRTPSPLVARLDHFGAQHAAAP